MHVDDLRGQFEPLKCLPKIETLVLLQLDAR
jgi:hypothetical protein